MRKSPKPSASALRNWTQSQRAGGHEIVALERRYYLSSLPLDVATIARAVWGHWGIENKLDWVLEVWLRDDQSRARTGYAAENLATLRRLVLNLLKLERTKRRA